jgi:hypothetical protein
LKYPRNLGYHGTLSYYKIVGAVFYLELTNRLSVTLPLHHGHPPQYLLARMKNLASSISKILVEEHGTREFLKRLADPLWFQSFGCVLGFDWHSSGLTTVVTGVLQRSVNLEDHGIMIAGGKGKKSISTRSQIPNLATIANMNGKRISDLLYADKMTAKVDTSAVQDGYDLYHHAVFFDDRGDWTIIQQGMNSDIKMARRYHWISDRIHSSFLSEPHSGIICDKIHHDVLDMTAHDSIETQKTTVDLVNGNPSNLISSIKKIQLPRFKTMDDWIFDHHSAGNTDLSYEMPTHLNWKTVKKIYDIQPRNYEEFVTIDGVGPSMIRALALISQLIYGSKTSWQDPVQFSFAHGGKDGVPFPINRNNFDRSIKFLKEAIEGGEISREDKRTALKRLSSNLRIILPGYGQ